MVIDQKIYFMRFLTNKKLRYLDFLHYTYIHLVEKKRDDPLI